MHPAKRHNMEVANSFREYLLTIDKYAYWNREDCAVALYRWQNEFPEEYKWWKAKRRILGEPYVPTF